MSLSSDWRVSFDQRALTSQGPLYKGPMSLCSDSKVSFDRRILTSQGPLGPMSLSLDWWVSFDQRILTSQGPLYRGWMLLSSDWRVFFDRRVLTSQGPLYRGECHCPRIGGCPSIGRSWHFFFFKGVVSPLLIHCIGGKCHCLKIGGCPLVGRSWYHRDHCTAVSAMSRPSDLRTPTNLRTVTLAP